MLYHDLLDCDPQTNSLRYKRITCWKNCPSEKPSFEEKTRFQCERVTCGKNYSARDNGALSSNTPQKAGHRAKNELRNAVPRSVRL